jgi:hypothetical protein
MNKKKLPKGTLLYRCSIYKDAKKIYLKMIKVKLFIL